MPKRLILAGDIGGTKNNPGLLQGDPSAPESVQEGSYQDRDFAGPTELVARFLADTGGAPSRPASA